MVEFEENIIFDSFTIREALARLDKIGLQANVLFVLDATGAMKGTITDGDIRRGLLKDLDVNSEAIRAANLNFYSIKALDQLHDIEIIRKIKSDKIRFVPLVEQNGKLVKIIDINNYKGFLPIDVFIMAGGKGTRLMPLTKDCPKPMLKIGNKPIIEHNIDRLASFGIHNFIISINYLGHVIKHYLKDGLQKGINISYVEEVEPLGTIGSISLVPEFKNEYVLVMNSDLLTDIDFLDFFETFKNLKTDLTVASIPYFVDIPYAVFEINDDNNIAALNEKPKYTYYSNAGIYLFKRQVLDLIPYNQFFNATDLIEAVIKSNGTVTSFPILSYWLDIGKMPDYTKAQEDIKHLKI